MEGNMTLFNINQLDPALVKRYLHAIDGIDPDIAGAIGDRMARQGPFQTKQEFMALIQQLGVPPRFFEVIEAAIGVSPPSLLFRVPDGDDNEERPRDRFFEGSGEGPAPPGKDCCGERCIWKYRIEGTIQQDAANITLPAGQRLVIRPKNATVLLVKAEGQVSFSCECTDPDNCQPKPFGLSYELPPDTATSDVSYDFTDEINRALALVGASITQPTLSVDTDVRVVATDSSCYAVKVLAKVSLTEGKITFAAQGVNLTDVVLGRGAEDTFVSTYRLCCCRIQKNLAMVQPADRNPQPNPIAPNEALDPDDCDCGCEFTFQGSRRANRAAPIDWKVTALEGGCRLQRVAVTNADGQTGVARNSSGQQIKPQARDGQGHPI